MYIYCNLVDRQFVSFDRALLPRSVTVNSKKNEVTAIEFSNVLCVSVSANNIDAVHMDIRRDDGSKVPFEGGKVQATVHFIRIGNK